MSQSTNWLVEAEGSQTALSPISYSVERQQVRDLPTLPPIIRYLDEYDDTLRSIRNPASNNVWTIQADTYTWNLQFSDIRDNDIRVLFKQIVFFCLLEFSPRTAVNIWEGLRSVESIFLCTWPLHGLNLSVAAWNDYWHFELRPVISERMAHALKCMLSFFCAVSLGGWHPGYRDFIRTLRWPKRTSSKSSDVIDGSSMLSVHDEALIIEQLDQASRRVEMGEVLASDQLLSFCLLCICYEHGLRPVQIGRMNLADLRTFDGDDGRPVVHFTAYRAKKRQSKDKTPFIRKIKREWGAPFVVWRQARMDQLELEGRSPSPSDKVFPISIIEISKVIGDTVELVTGTRRTATDLRHNAAQRLVDAGASVEEVANFLGHSYWDTSLVYFEASAAQGPNINKALAASPIYSRIVEIARNGYIDRPALEVADGDQQIGAVPHGIPVSGIGACSLGQSLCSMNPAMSCYTCRRFIPIDEPDVHRQVLTDFRGVVRFFYDESRGDRQSPAYMQLRTTLDAVQNVVADLSAVLGEEEP